MCGEKDRGRESARTQAHSGTRAALARLTYGRSTALQLYGKGGVKLIPPQWYTILELNQVRQHSQLAAHARARASTPFQPEFTSDDKDQAVAALPGDPLHPDGAVRPTDRHRIIVRGTGRGGMDMALECNLPGHALATANAAAPAKL